MVIRTRVLVSEPCECGDERRWARSGWLRPRWRQECICGRCGPWRAHPTRRLLGSPASLRGVSDAPPPKK